MMKSRKSGHVYHISVKIFLVFVPALKPRKGGKPKATWATCDVSRETPEIFFIIICFLKLVCFFMVFPNAVKK